MRPLSLLLLALAACAPEPADDDGADTDPGQPIEGDLETLRGQQVFDVPLRDPVDVLFVVDDEHSDMVFGGLPRSADAFVEPLVREGVDAHIGVGTTDMQDRERKGRLLGEAGARWVDTTQPGAEAALVDLFDLVGHQGSWFERGASAALAVIDPDDPDVESHNRGFLRPSSRLHVIFVVESEEDETDMDAFRDVMLAEDRARAAGALASVVGGGGEGCPDTPEGFHGAEPTPRYELLAATLDGLFLSVCDTTVEEQLTSLAAHTLTAGQDRVYLAELPIANSIKGSVLTEAWERPLVSLSDQPEGTRCQDCVSFQYEFQRNALRFVEPLPFGARVTVDYELLEARD